MLSPTGEWSNNYDSIFDKNMVIALKGFSASLLSIGIIRIAQIRYNIKFWLSKPDCDHSEK